MFIRRFSPLQSAGQPHDAWRRLRVCVIYFPAHFAGVTNISPHYNLSPAVKIYRRHRRMSSSSARRKDYRLVPSNAHWLSCVPVTWPQFCCTTRDVTAMNQVVIGAGYAFGTSGSHSRRSLSAIRCGVMQFRCLCWRSITSHCCHCYCNSDAFTSGFNSAGPYTARPTNGSWRILSWKSLSPDSTNDTYLHKFRGVCQFRPSKSTIVQCQCESKISLWISDDVKPPLTR